MEKKLHHLHFVLDDVTNKKLHDDARRCGLSRSAYIRRLIMKAPIKARPPEQLGKLYAEINHIGNNINQIARSVNAGIATSETAAEAVLLLKKVYALMEKVADG